MERTPGGGGGTAPGVKEDAQAALHTLTPSREPVGFSCSRVWLDLGGHTRHCKAQVCWPGEVPAEDHLHVSNSPPHNTAV